MSIPNDTIYVFTICFRVKFFTWLALQCRLWTADRRWRRHGLDPHDNCCLCDQEPEMADHLLVNCSYTKAIWWNTLSWMTCQCSFPEPLRLHSWWKRGFNTLFMLIIWALWRERNNRLFQRVSTHGPNLQKKIKMDIKLWIDAGARCLGCLKWE